MSFGFSIGDFVAAIELANRIRKEFVHAPGQFKAISDEVRSLSIILQDINIKLSEHELNDHQQARLQEISSNCRNVLNEVEETASKYQELEYKGGSMSTKVKKIWKRLKWEPEDIRELRDRIISNVLLLSTFLGGISSQIITEAKLGVDQPNQKQNDQEQQLILDWLTPVDYASQQSDFRSRRQAGTGQWLLDSAEFKAWVGTDKRTLFCPGIPGAGKTILTSIVVEELFTRFENDGNTSIAYLYCNYQRQHEQNLEDLFTSLLKQFVQEQPSIPESVKTLYNRHKDKRTRPLLDEILGILEKVAITYSRVFIIVDALDECQISHGYRQRFLSGLFNLQAKSGANLFATSRPISSIEKVFEGKSKLEIRATEDDIRRYLEGHMIRLPGFVAQSLELQEEIKKDIVKAVEGMFLLAQLYLDSLTGKRSPKAVRATLKNLAIGSGAYDHAYENAMERINGQIQDQKELAKQALSWITCAKRQLTTIELQHALGVEIGESELDVENLSQIEDIVSVCAGLVTIDKESGIIRLVHYTTQEYLERTRRHWFLDAESEITTVCVTYLSFAIFRSGICPTDKDFKQRLQSNKLYDYASNNWGHHAREALILCQGVIEFLQKQAQVEASSQALMAFERRWGFGEYIQGVPKQMTGLHLAAYFGVEVVIPLLLEQGAELETKATIYGRTPLLWAAKNGHEGVIQLLLDRGAELETKDELSRKPLSWAARSRHEAVTRLLLDRGAELESKDKDGQTPLSLAAEKGYEAVATLLLDRGAELESKDKDGRTPLSWAAEKGYEAVATLLLDRGAELESKDKDGRTPLSWAAEKGYEAAATLLLDRGAELESKDKDGRTPLSWAAGNGHQVVVQLLLNAVKADIDIKDRGGRTPLSYAAQNGHEAVLQQLLDTGQVDTDGKDSVFGQTPLSLAAEEGHDNVVKLLLEIGEVNANSQDGEGWTPLSYAARNGHEAVVKLLLDTRKVDPDMKYGIFGRTPLSWAARNGHRNVAQLLLDKGADLAAIDSKGQMPLHWAAYNGHLEVVQLLLDYGADVKAATTSGQIPLHRAFDNGHLGVVQLLLGRCADINAKETEDLLKSFQMRWSRLSSNEERSEWLETLALIGTHQKLGADTIPKQWSGYLRCQWEIPDVLEETRTLQATPEHFKLRDDIYNVLARFITLTGTTDKFECSTCGEFLEKRWNDIGSDALRVISRGLEFLASPEKLSQNLTRQENPQTADISIISATKNHITIFVNSTEYDKQSFVEAINWTCAAIRATLNVSKESSGKLLVSETFKAIQIQDQQPQLLGYSIQPLKDLSEYDIGVHDCWTNLFKSGVVAWSPTQRQWGFGLELSFNMMVHLATVESYYWLDDRYDGGGLVLLGFFTALVPTSHHEASKSIQWHFESSEAIINPHSLESTQRTWIKIQDASELQHSRCFVGWYERANILLGTRRLETHLNSLTWSGLKTRERTLHNTGFQAGVEINTGSGYVGPINLALQAMRSWIFQTNVQQFTAPTQYSTAVALSSNKVALVMDSESKQAWLIPKLSLILHLCHKYFQEFKPRVGYIKDPIPFAEPAPNGSWAAQQAIVAEGDTIVLGTLDQADTETLRQVFLRINTNLLDSVKTREKPRNAVMFASEMMDMWDQPATGSPLREVNINRCARSWTCLVSIVDVFCVCANIGPAIEPVPIPNHVCDCCMLPTNQYYLAAHMWCLEQLSKRARSSTSQLQHGMCKLGEDAVWCVQTSPWRRCGPETHPSIWGDIDLLDTLLQKVSNENKHNDKEAPEIVLHEPPPDTGVVVFGARHPKILGKLRSRMQS
ncbi:hypothetical protein V8E51_011036 [Hyaloscypha variabilis]